MAGRKRPATRVCIERAILLCEGDMIIPDDLPTEVRQNRRPRLRVVSNYRLKEFSFEEVEKNLILQAMDQTDYNITKAAKLLGLLFARCSTGWRSLGLRGGRERRKGTNEG